MELDQATGIKRKGILRTTKPCVEISRINDFYVTF